MHKQSKVAHVPIAHPKVTYQVLFDKASGVDTLQQYYALFPPPVRKENELPFPTSR